MARRTEKTTESQTFKVDKNGEIKGGSFTTKKEVTQQKGIKLHGGVNAVLGGVVFFLLLTALIRVISNQEIPTFASFLDMLTNIPDVTTTFNIFEQLTVKTNLGWFDEFVNVLSSLVSVVWYLIGGIIQLLIYATYVISWIF